MLNHINKQVVGVALTILLVLAGVLFYSLGDDRGDSALTSTDASALDGVLGRELLMTLATLKSTALDAAIFDDTVFQSLRDAGVEIAPQPVGRRNPFAPFGAASEESKSAKPSSPSNQTPRPAAAPLPPHGAIESFGAETPGAASEAEPPDELLLEFGF